MRAALAGALGLVAADAHAAACEVSVSDLAFGQVVLLATLPDAESTADVTVGCTDDGGPLQVTYEISISAGVSGSFAPRTMTGPGTLAYNLYADPARTIVWGDGNDGTILVAGALLLPGLGSAVHTAYGRIPASQPGVTPGVYGDVLTITLTY